MGLECDFYLHLFFLEINLYELLEAIVIEACFYLISCSWSRVLCFCLFALSGHTFSRFMEFTASVFLPASFTGPFFSFTARPLVLSNLDTLPTRFFSVQKIVLEGSFNLQCWEFIGLRFHQPPEPLHGFLIFGCFWSMQKPPTPWFSFPVWCLGVYHTPHLYLLLSPAGCWYHTGSINLVLGPLLFKFWSLWRQVVINFTEHMVGLYGFDFALLVALWYAKNLFFFHFWNHFLRIPEEFPYIVLILVFGIFYPTFSKKNQDSTS